MSSLARWRKPALSTLTFAVFLMCAGPAQSQTTALFIDSQPGDPVGAGARRTWTTAEADFVVLTWSASHMEIRLRAPGSSSTFWELGFLAPSGAPLAPGVYDNAAYVGARSSRVPGFALWRSGFASCSSDATGRFEVFEIVFNSSGAVTKFAADFEYHCGDAVPALFGALRYDSSRASLVPFDGAYPRYSLGIVQPAHGSVVADGISCGGGPTDCSEIFGAPRDVLLEALPDPGYVFVGWTGDCSGAEVTILAVTRQKACAPVFNVAPAGAGINDPDLSDGALFVDSPAGYQPIGRLRHVWTAADSDFTVGMSSRESVLLSIRRPDGDSFRLLFRAAPGTELSPDTYDFARGGHDPDAEVGLSFASCDSRGRFRIHEIAFTGTTMTALAADFEIRCSNGLDAVVGSVRFNSARTSLLPFDGAYPDISLRINATQGGYVTGGGLDCGAGRLDCEQSYGSAGHVSLEAVPSPGYSFVAWSDDCSGASPSTSVFVVLQTRCRAIFHPTQGQPGPADPAFADGALWLHRPSDPGAPLNVWVAPDVAFYPTVSGRSYVSMRMVLPNGREWRGSFAGRAGADLAPGTYEPASLSISGDLAPSCWTVKGSRVVVYEISWTAGGALASFAADFEQHCESDGVVSATFGAVRYHSTRPTLMPFDGAYPDIRLQITPSPLGFVSAAGLYCGPGQPDCEETYGSATTVALQAVPAAGSVFAGWTGDCEGRAATTVQVGRRLFCAAEFYLAPGTPGEDNARLRNGSLLIDSETGDSFGQGRRRLWTFDDASVSTLWSTASEVMLRFTTPDGNTWTFEFETAWSAPLLPGDYKDVEASSSLGNQGLSRLYIQGPSGSCHGTAAQFRIYEVAFDGAGKLSTFAADFEARCGAAYRPAVRGAVRFHSTRSSVTPYGEPLVQFSHSLRVLRSGIGSGTVTSSPAGIACRTDCNTVFPSAAMVTLTAAADAGSRFAGWLGSCRGTAPTCVLPMDSHRTVSPAFEPFAIPDAPVQVSPAGFLQSDSQTFVWRAVHAATWYYLWVDDSTGTRVRRWISSEEARCGTGTGYCSESAFGLASGPGRWWVIAWNPAGASAWGPGMAFSIAPVLDATILSPYPVPDVLPGGTARLWANVKNTGRTSLPTGTKTWFVVSGPNWTGDPWVGAADVSGLHPGSTRWVSFDWVVPAGRSAGTHNYFSRVYATGVGPISTPGAAQSFQISGGPTARIDALYPVTGATRGGTASLWARVTNTSAAAMPAGAKIWYYVDGPGWTGDHWVASVSIQGLAPGASQWYLLTYSIPGAAQAGTYTYWVQAWWGSAISPWSAGQSFVVQ